MFLRWATACRCAYLTADFTCSWYQVFLLCESVINGIAIAAKIAEMVITTTSSIRVNPRRRIIDGSRPGDFPVVDAPSGAPPARRDPAAPARERGQPMRQ